MVSWSTTGVRRTLQRLAILSDTRSHRQNGSRFCVLYRVKLVIARTEDPVPHADRTPAGAGP